MAGVNEAAIVNGVAKWERSIAGIRHAFDFGQAPDTIAGKTPCVLHLPLRFTMAPLAHHNVWRTEIFMQSVLFVAEVQAQGARNAWLENEALPYGYKWREKFQTKAVIEDLFVIGGGLVKVFLTGGRYAQGGNLLTWGGVPYIGWIFDFNFLEGN